MKSDGTKVPTQMLELLPEIVIPKSFQKTNILRQDHPILAYGNNIRMRGNARRESMSWVSTPEPCVRFWCTNLHALPFQPLTKFPKGRKCFTLRLALISL